ncbi:Epsilon-sarcoglycan [Halotydeus destructor]|nr:Epsilon-sarcoglycan [Halotydeus destructor]
MMGDLVFICHIVICMCVVRASADSEHRIQLNTTEAFFYAIKKEHFGQGLENAVRVEYLPSVQGMADLPKWMMYMQPNSSANGFLYGSPETAGHLDIEIVAMNRFNYETFNHVVRFNVHNRTEKAKFHVELKLSNVNVEDVFDEVRVNELVGIFRDKLWKDNQVVYATLIVSPSDIGGRRPLNPKDKEGVLVRFGSTRDFSRDLLDLEREVEPIKNRKPCPRKYKATSAEHLFRAKNLAVDWCSLRLIRSNSTSSDSGPELATGGEWPESVASLDDRPFLEIVNGSSLVLEQLEGSSFRTYRVRDRDYAMDLLYCALIPLSVAAILVPCLCCVFFAKKGANKETHESPQQLEQYYTLRRVHSQLRQLATNRDQLSFSTL